MHYWTAQGYLSRSPRHLGRYSGETVEPAILIKQGLGHGLAVSLAARQARAYLAAERSGQPDLHALDAAAPATIASRVARADAAVRQVLDVVVPLAPPMEAAH